jgi:hypothetical protein
LILFFINIVGISHAPWWRPASARPGGVRGECVRAARAVMEASHRAEQATNRSCMQGDHTESVARACGQAVCAAVRAPACRLVGLVAGHGGKLMRALSLSCT